MDKRSKATLKALLERNLIGVDKTTFKRDGTAEVAHAYFYRFGESEDTWGAQVAKAVGPDFKVVSTEDRYANWPKTSYFVATVAVG